MNKHSKKRKKITSDQVDWVFLVETAIFMGLMAIGALGLMYALVKLLLFFLGGITVNKPFF